MSTLKNRRWLVVPTVLTGSINFNQVLESSIDSLRLSIDGTKTFIKYEITEILEDEIYTVLDPGTGVELTYVQPAGIYGRPSIYKEGDVEYTHEQILEILSTSEWTELMEELK